MELVRDTLRRTVLNGFSIMNHSLPKPKQPLSFPAEYPPFSRFSFPASFHSGLVLWQARLALVGGRATW